MMDHLIEVTMIFSSTMRFKAKVKGQNHLSESGAEPGNRNTVHSNELFITPLFSFPAGGCFFITRKSLFHPFHSVFCAAVHQCDMKNMQRYPGSNIFHK